MSVASTTHLVLIPSYNPGTKVYETVRAARQYWNPVWVVVDGSNDGSAEGLQALAVEDAGLRVIVLPQNQGKGAAVLHGLEQAAAAGFSHVLSMYFCVVRVGLDLEFFRCGARRLVRSDESVFPHALNDVKLARPSPRGIADRVVSGRRLGQAGQHGGFGN